MGAPFIARILEYIADGASGASYPKALGHNDGLSTSIQHVQKLLNSG